MTRNLTFITLALLMIAALCAPVMAWGPDAHIKEADAAAPYAGIASLSTFESASVAPDSWSCTNGGSCQHSQFTGAASWTDNLVNQAISEKKSSNPDWVVKTGNAVHFMTDMSMPYHVNLWPNSVTQNAHHNQIESWASGQLGYSSFKTKIQNAVPVTVTSPSSSVYSLASSSGQWATYYENMLNTYPNSWQNDPNVNTLTSDLLKDASSYNKGLVSYVNTKSNQ